MLWQWGKTLIKRQNYEIWNIDDLLGAMVFVSACDKTREEQIRPVAVYALAEHDAVFTAKFPSIVEAGNEAVLSFKVAGSILEFPYETGAYVQKGQVLVRLDERDYAVQLEAGKRKKCWRQKMRIWG